MNLDTPAAREEAVTPSPGDPADRGPTPQRQRRVAFSRTEVALGLLLFAAVWLGMLTGTSLSPPVDNIEQLTWVRSLEWGYYKHPPLPTWLIWLPVQLCGLSVWVSYWMGALMTLGALALMWRLLLSLRGPTYAGLALLAALCITYYNGRLSYYNHNIVLLFIATACAALCWRAFATRRLRWWLALGVAVGLGLLTKYQMAVTVASVLAVAAQQRVWRDPVQRQGLLCAMLVALLVVVPHIEWLRGHDFGPIAYAEGTSIGVSLDAWARLRNSAGWLADQLLNRGVLAFVLLAVVALQVRTSQRAAPPAPGLASPPRQDLGRAVIWAWGLLPLCFMPLVGVVTGADLQLHWGTPFLLFAVPAAMELAPPGFWTRADLSKALCVFLVIQALVMTRGYVTSPRGIAALGSHYWRHFDSQELERRVADAARAELHGPIRVVIGVEHEAETLALQLPERPLVLIGGRFEDSPWVPRDAVERCGAVELGPSATMKNATPVGLLLPATSWRVIRPRPGAAPCTL